MSKYDKFKKYGDEIRFHYCPICGKEKENPDFSVNLKTGQYYCHSTGQGGNIKEIEDFDFKLPDIKKVKTTAERQTFTFDDLMKKRAGYHLGDDWLNYLKERGISEKGLNRLCRLGKENMMMIPITDGKNVVAIKYRTLDKKCKSERGSRTDYFLNWQNVKDKSYLIIVEGEIDLLSAIEVGFDNVVSVPFGAQNIKCIETQKDWIMSFEKIIIAVDNDDPGKKCKEEIIKELYSIKDRLYSVNYGEFKDFNEVLTGGGTETLKNIILGAEKIVLNPAFAPSFFGEKGKFLFDVFANFLKEKFNIIKIDNELHCYIDGIYSKGKSLEKNMIELIPNLKDTHRKEVLKYLDLICESKEKNNDGLIAFKNGIYNIFTNELTDFSPDYVVTNKVPWRYKKETYSKLMDQTLNKFACDDKGIRKLIDEVVGYTLFSKNELGKSFIITGDKANGKSTFLKILIYMLGKENCSALSLDDVVNSRFRIYQVAGKLLNVGDDIGNGYIPEAETLRKLITGDIVTAEQKGKDPIEFNCYAKFIFSANDIPRIKDPTGATARRIIVIPFKNKFDRTKENYDPYFLDKVKTEECMEYLISIGIVGLKRILENKGFSETEETKVLLEEFNRNNNPILEYIDFLENEIDSPINLDYLISTYSCMKILNGVYDFPNKDRLIGFNEWAVDNGHQKTSIKKFKDAMCAQYNLETKRINKELTKETYFLRKNY